jgi:cation-transporting P-type ATPase 13A2
MATTLTITMVWTKATEKLTKEKPISSLLEKSNLISVFGAVTIQFLGQLFVIVSLVRRDFYIYVDPEAYQAEAAASEEEDDYYDLPVETMETTSLFFFSNILMIGCSMIFAEGHPFKKEFWTNKLYVANCVILFIYMWVMAGEKDSRFPELELYGDVLTEDEEGNDIPVA